MAGTSGCSRQLGELKLSTTARAMGESDERDHVAAPASAPDLATTSACGVSAGSGSRVESEESGERSARGQSVEEQIERSKVHWSLLVDGPGCSDDEEVAEVSNIAEFKALQSHPTWGDFFSTFGYDLGGRYKSQGELVMGEKFAEGGQAELYEAQVTWWYPEGNEEDERYGTEYVLKVFKKGTFLKHIKHQMPQGLLQYHVEDMANLISLIPRRFPRYRCKVHRGVLLKDGRFAFLMEKEHIDLRALIEHNMKLKSGEACGPFSKKEAEAMMYRIALGVEWLHSRDMIHRDLKASNVLVREFKSSWPKHNCFIADYECSVGVVGTGFFRAPEILQACKDRKLSERPEVFSKAADIYGYGMVCYEVLTGKLPFEGYCTNDYDLVLNGNRLELPKYIDGWVCNLLNRCWEIDPKGRPRIGEILDELVAKSVEVKKQDVLLKKQFGNCSRSRHEKFRFSKLKKMVGCGMWKLLN